MLGIFAATTPRGPVTVAKPGEESEADQPKAQVKKPSWPYTPSLIDVPSLDATLRMHREYLARCEEDIDWDWDGNVTHHSIYAQWQDLHEEMSEAVLVARAIVNEIDKGLQLLGLNTDKLLPANTGDEEADFNRDLDEFTFLCDALEKLPDDLDTKPVFWATELIRTFRAIGDNWIVDERHITADTCVDEEEGIYVTTLDEWELDCPEIPSVEGLRDWNDVEDLEEGYFFDTIILLEECKKVLVHIAELVLRTEASK